MKFSTLAIVTTLGLLAGGPQTITPPATHAAPISAANPHGELPGNAAIAAQRSKAITLKVSPAAVSLPVLAQASAVAGRNANHYTVVTHDGSRLNVRARNSMQSAIIGSIPDGTQVLMHISDRSGEWLEVSAPGNIRGWVSAQYLIDSKGNTASPSLRAAGERLANSTRADAAARARQGRRYRVKTMDGDALNLRNQPQLDGRVIMTLPNGSSVTEVGTVGRWTQVVTADGIRGYVATDYLVAD